MTKREIELVRDICHEVDLRVTSDPQSPGLDVLERTRLKMDDYLWQGKYREAENTAYAILLMLSGDQASRYLLEEVGDQ
jgi:hypothetical protein